MSQCMYCSAPLPEGAIFCPTCGKKQVVIYRQVFQRGHMNEADFINSINHWFSIYPRVANVKADIHLTSTIGALTNKYRLEAVTIEYEMLNGENRNQYAMVALSNFDFVKTETNDLVQQWKKSYPGATIVARNGGVHQRGSSASLVLGGIGANNKTQVYLLFKFNRKYGPMQLPPQQQ